MTKCRKSYLTLVEKKGHFSRATIITLFGASQIVFSTFSLVHQISHSCTFHFRPFCKKEITMVSLCFFGGVVCDGIRLWNSWFLYGITIVLLVFVFLYLYIFDRIQWCMNIPFTQNRGIYISPKRIWAFRPHLKLTFVHFSAIICDISDTNKVI